MVRYLLEQPRKLESLAIKKLGDYILLQGEKLEESLAELHQRDATKAEALLSRQIEVVRTRLDCNVPRMLHDKLLEEITRAVTGYLRDRDNSKTFVMGRMVETILTRKLTYISLSYREKFLASICSKSYMITSLVELRLYRLNISETETIQLLKELHCLKKLSCDICSEAILKCIVDNCKLIEDLTLSGTCIADNGIDILTELSNLTTIDLNYTGVTQKGVETLIISCKNIEHIIDTRLIANALEHIASLKENAGKRFKLKSFDSKRHTVLEPKQLQFIIQMCPQIQNINFDASPPNSGCDPNFHYREPIYYPYKLIALNDLQDLCQLNLMNYSFYRDRLKEVIQVRGQNLVDMNLEVYEMDLNALKCLVQTCPNLESLSINFLIHYEETNLISIVENVVKRTRKIGKNLYSKEHKTKQIGTLHLKNLKRLSVDITPMHENLIIFLLASCPNVEFINTGFHVSLTDDIMLKVLDKNPLSSLKTLTMWQSKLSVLSIDRLIQNCVNPPVVLLNV